MKTWINLPGGYPEILAELASIIHERLVERHVQNADIISMVLAEDIRMKWGGGLIYIPKGTNYVRQKRDDAVLSAFDGRNHAELAKRFDITISRVYEILSRRRGNIFKPMNSESATESVNNVKNELS